MPHSLGRWAQGTRAPGDRTPAAAPRQGVRHPVSECPSPQLQAHLQTLGGALMEPSVVGGGGATEAGQKLLRASTKLGDAAAGLGKAGAARLLR